MPRHASMPFVLAGALALVVLLATTSSAVAGGWIDTVEIAPSGGAQPSVAMTPQGDVVVAWRADVSVATPHTKIFRRVKPAGEGFDVENGFGDIRKTEDRPSTAVDAQGRPWIAFHSDTSNTVVLLRGVAGDPTSFTGVATFIAAGSITDGPQLAVGSNAAAVTYKDGNTLRLGTWSQADGAADVELQNATDGEPLHARVTLDDAGNVMTAWTRDPGILGSPCVVETRRRAAGAALSAIQPVGSSGIFEAPQCFDNDVDLVLGPTGRVLASWYDEYWSETRYALAAPGAAFGSEATAASASPTVPSRVRGLLGTADDSLLTYLTDVPAEAEIHTTQWHTSGGVATTGALDIVQATVSLARNSSDAAVGAWSDGPCPVWAAVGTVSGGLGTPAAIGSCGGNLQVAIDTGGDAVAVWDVSGGTIMLDIYDNTPPGLTNVSVPATTTTGLPVPVSATASDALSNATVHWRFGDGEEADGTNSSHVYANPGIYQVEVDATDQGGNVTTEQRTIDVLPPPPTASISAPLNGSILASPVTASYSTTGATSITCQWDVETILSPCPASPPAPKTLTAGSHTFKVTATNIAGSVTATSTFTVLPPPPTASISAPADGSTVTSPVTAGYSTTNATTITCQWNAETVLNPCPASPLAAKMLAAGSNTFKLTATNAAGSATATSTFTVLPPPPPQDPLAGPNTSPPPPAVFGDGPTITVLGAKLVMNKKGVVRINLACPAGTDGSCSGPVTLELGTQTASVRVLGKRSFSATAGSQTTLKLKLSKKSRKFVLKKRRIKATLRIIARDRLGRSHTTLKAVSVKAAKRK